MAVSEEAMVAEMLFRYVLFVDEREGGGFDLSVNCNDLFSWATSEGEPITFDEIEAVYAAWKSPDKWALEKWACRHRKRRPQKKVEERMRADGSWLPDMDEFPGESPLCQPSATPEGSAER